MDKIKKLFGSNKELNAGAKDSGQSTLESVVTLGGDDAMRQQAMQQANAACETFFFL